MSDFDSILGKDMFDALVRHLPDCVFIKNAAGAYLMINKAMAGLLGCNNVEDALGKTDFDFISPEKALLNQADEQHILNSGLPILEKSEFFQNSVRSAWYSISRIPIRNADGKVTGMIGIGRDISDHVLSEKRERATSQDLKAVVEIADRLIYSSDLDTLLRKAVELARTLLHVERCSILINYGEHLRGTFGTDLQAQTTDERSKIIPIDAAWEHRFRMWNRKSSQWIIERDIHRSSPDARTSSTRDFWVATTPIKGTHNRLIGAFCNDTVITGSPPDERLQDVIAVFCSLLGNIIERQQSIDELQIRDKVLEGVARAANQLLIVNDLSAAIEESLRVLGESLNVDRVYIYKNHTDSLTGEWFMNRTYQWVREIQLAMNDSDDPRDLPYHPVFSAMYERLISGQVYGGPVSMLTMAEKYFFERKSILSILVVPIHINNQFWGLIGFDDCRTAREWNNYEKTTLMAMAGNLGGAITQDLTERELKSRDRILSGVAKANHELLTNPDLDTAIINALRILAPAVNVERIYLCENFPGGTPGDPHMCPRFVYTKKFDRMDKFSSREYQFSYAGHLPGWYRIMSAGKPIHGRLLDFLNESSADVRSVLLAPVMIENKFWGIIGFDTSDSEHNWTESDVSTLATMAGSIGGAIARKRAEESLRTSEEHFRSLIENASDLILVINTQGLILYGSPSVDRELGYHTSFQPRINFLEIIHPDDGPAISNKLNLTEQVPGNSDLLKLRVRHAAGKWMHIECAIKSIPADSDQFRFVINARDITQRIRAEEALRNSEELLRHSQRMEAVGRLAGGISHDFNNLLTAILGYGDLLLSQIPADNVWRNEIGEIHNAAERAHSLTRQLLAFSRRQAMEPKQVDLNQVVNEMERLLKRLISEDVLLVTTTDIKPCMVKVDRSQIEQVIINLSLNARDAMKGGGKLIIVTENTTITQNLIDGMVTIQPGEYVLLRVSDTGHGIDEEIRPHIFEPFFTTKEVGKGTGLGLSMVYGTIEQSGGHILFKSVVGKGTDFIIYLPRVEPGEEAVVELPATSTLGGKETIMLIEDDLFVRKLCLRILHDKGYHVIEQENGEMGIEYFKLHSNTIDLVLTDIIMPQMSGLSFARAARKIKPTIRVLFMSGYSEDQQPELHETDEGRNYIQKPFTVATLCSRIRELLDSPPGTTVITSP